MTNVVRKHHSSVFKTKVALAAAKGDKTMTQLSGEFGVTAAVITKWRKEMLEGIPRIFSERGSAKRGRNQDKMIPRLYQEIGRLKIELELLKEQSGYTD
jgi:putative transposase